MQLLELKEERFNFSTLLVKNTNSSSPFCSDDSDCHYGTCNGGNCVCLNGYTGKDCNTLYEDYLGTPYLVYFYIMCVMYLVQATVCIYRLSILFYYRRTIRTRHISLALLTISTVLRTLNYWTEVDMKFGRNQTIEPYGGLTWYLWYPCVVSAYTCELFIWLELFGPTSLIDVENLPRYKKIVAGINAVVFPIEFIVRITQLFVSPSIKLLLWIIWAIYLFGIVLVEAIGFIFVGVKLLRKVASMTAITAKDARRETLIKFTKALLLVSGLVIFGLIMILIAVVAGGSPWGWFIIAIFARIVELGIVYAFLMIVRSPRKDHGSSTHFGSDETTKGRTALSMNALTPTPSYKGHTTTNDTEEIV